MTQVNAPDGAALAAILGRGDDTAWISSVGNLVASTATQLASTYCRAVGFGADDSGNVLVPNDLYSVILLRALRLSANYSQLISQTEDGVTQLYGAAGQGWTLEELTALNAYRVTAG